MTNFLAAALEYHRHGFRVIPVSENKRPCNLLARHNYEWKPFQREQTERDVRELFSKDSHGLAVLTGIDGLECIDIDTKYSLVPDLEVQYMDLIDSLGGVMLPDTVMVKTRSGGFHVLYRCDSPGRNMKLAIRPPTNEELASDRNVTGFVLFETRGEGGYIVAAPTPGYSMYHGKMSSIPRLTMGQRDTLLRAAMAFNLFETPIQQTPEQKRAIQESCGETTIEAFNRQASIGDLLERHGWSFVKKVGQRNLYKRPGTTEASHSADWHEGLNIFKCFSTSSSFIANKGYSPFGVYATLEHNGNWSEAARALHREGYGDRVRLQSVPAKLPLMLGASEVGDIELELSKRSFDIDSEPKQVDFYLRCEVNDKWFDVGGAGDIGLVEGAEKSRKTTFLKALLSSCLDDGKKRINFHLDLKGGNMVFFDTEQGRRSFWNTHKQAHMMAQRAEKPSFYNAYSLRDQSVEQRVAMIDYVISTRENLSLIVIDGILDLTKNFNSEQQAQEAAELVMGWAERSNAMIICVIHQTKANGYTMGHLGSMLARKCSFSIEMSYDEDSGITTVKSKRTRDTQRFPPFDFFQDEHGFPILNHHEAYIVRDGIATPKNHFVEPNKMVGSPTLELPLPPRWAVLPSEKNDETDIPF